MRQNRDYVSRHTYLTLRYLYANDQEGLERCATAQDVKELLWKHQKPLQETSNKRVISYRLQVGESDKRMAVPVYQVDSLEDSTAYFLKGITFVNWQALCEWVKDLKKPHIQTVVNNLSKHTEHISVPSPADEFQKFLDEDYG